MHQGRLLPRILTLAVGLGILLFPSRSQATGILLDDAIASGSLSASSLFVGGSPMGVAFDGTSYWAASGGSTLGQRLVRFDSAGNFIAAYSPGIDFRSLFTDSSGNLYATDYGANGGIHVFSVSTAGVASMLYTLPTKPGGDNQSEFGLEGNILYGHSSGTIYTYDFATGAAIGSFSLIGSSLTTYPASAQLAVVDNRLLTYSSSGLVQAWDLSGNLLGGSVIGLNAFNDIFSFSFADDRVWIGGNAGFTGYDIGLQQVAAPEPGTLLLFTTAAFTALRLRRRKHLRAVESR